MVTQGNLGLTLPPNPLELYKNSKMKSWTDPASSFLGVTPGTKIYNYLDLNQDLSGRQTCIKNKNRNLCQVYCLISHIALFGFCVYKIDFQKD